MTPDEVLWALVSAWREQAERKAAKGHALATVESNTLAACAAMLTDAINWKGPDNEQ